MQRAIISTCEGDMLRLDVAVRPFVRVQVRDCFDDLLEDGRRLRLLPCSPRSSTSDRRSKSERSTTSAHSTGVHASALRRTIVLVWRQLL